MKKIVLQLLSLFFIIPNLYSQKLNLSFGRNISTYHLENSQGYLVDYLKSGTGNTIQATFLGNFLDTLNLQTKSPEKVLKFSKKPLLSKILSQFTYSAGIQMSQLNAVGNIQQIALLYNTDYLGATIGLGYVLHLVKRFSIHAETQIIANKLLQGQQQTASSFYSLSGNSQFDGIKFFKGFRLAITGKVNTTTDLIISYNFQSSSTPSESNTGKLTIDSQLLAIGLTLAIN